MKKISLYFLAAMAGLFVFTSCEKEKEENKEVTITFESVQLNADGYQNNFTTGLVLSDVDFYNYFDEAWSSWEGFAVSNLKDKVKPGYENEFSVYGNGGANNSEKFAVVYSGFNEITNCQFLNGQEYTFKNLMINNSTYAYLTIKDGNSFGTQPFGEDDWFKIIITGFNAAGEKTGKTEFYLADFRDGKTFICQEWTKVNLLGLGSVNKLEFTFESTDNGDWGMNTPAYACVDDIVFALD